MVQMSNAEMDHAILSRLDNGVTTLRDIHTSLELPGIPSNDRQLDQRLKALKKSGQICYLRKSAGGPGWALVATRRMAIV